MVRAGVDAYGIPLGTLTERFDRFDEGVEVICRCSPTTSRRSRAGTTASPTPAASPKPVQARLPIVIGGKGPRRTLRTVARWADHWDVVRPDDPAAVDPARRDVLATTARRSGAIRPRSGGPSTSCGPRTTTRPSWPTRAAGFGDAGVDLVIFSMRGPYEARLLDPLAAALTG